MKKISLNVAPGSSASDLIGRPLRTPGCIVLYCTAGRAGVECNFRDIPFRKGDMAVIFFDILFSIKRVSPGFGMRGFELSETLTDEATFTSGGPFFDWIYEHPVIAVPRERKRDVELWLKVMDWIESNASGKYCNMMLRNQWQNFFLGLEAVLQPMLSRSEETTISNSRKLITAFNKLLCDNCRTHHDVKFYADRLCITPYYLSCITRKYFSASPKELIDRQIMMEIKWLLTTTELSVKEIAERYNFESTSYLGRFFRRHLGMTPSAFRALH